MDTYTTNSGKTYHVGDVLESYKASVDGRPGFPVTATWTPAELDSSWNGSAYVEVYYTRSTITRIETSRFDSIPHPYMRQDHCEVVAAWKMTKRGWKSVTL